MKNFYTNVAIRGDNILFRGVVDGKRKTTKIPNYNPTVFLPTNKETNWRTIDGRYAEPFQAGSIRELREFTDKYKDVANFEIHGQIDIAVRWIAEEYGPGKIEYDPSLIRIFDMDIEVRSPDGFPEPERADDEICSISFHDSLTKKYHVFTMAEYIPHMPNIVYVKCDDELQLIKSFIHFWVNNCPDIVTGWNVRFFDIAYLINRINKVLGERWSKALSPWQYISERNITIQGTTKQTYEISGVAIMDAIELYKKYTYVKQESYKLGYIAHVEELPVQKITYAGKLDDLYLNDPQKFIEYNIADIGIVEALLAKHKFIDIVLGIAYKAKVNWNTVYSPVATWDAYIYNYFLTQNICIPPERHKSALGDQYVGAHVKEPIPGKYKWVITVDARSLYPCNDMQWNIGPDTIIDDFEWPEHIQTATMQDFVNGSVDLSFAKANNYTFTANKCLFRKDKKSVFAVLFNELLTGRDIAKKKMIETKIKAEKEGETEELKQQIAALHNEQLVAKVFANSGYGAMGNNYFRYFDVRLAEAITMSGQLVILWAEKRINQYMNKILGTKDQNYIIMIDTDALYITFDALIEKLGMTDKNKIVAFLDTVCKEKIQPELDKYFKELFEYTNAYEQHIWMKREAIAESVMVVAKKRYAMSIWDNEGVRYEKPKTKITGIEAVRSSTPEFCRKKIKDALGLVLSGTESELQAYISKVEIEFKSLNPNQMAFPRGINDLDKYADSKTVFKKGTPIHVKGALIYNYLLKHLKIDKKYPSIQDGDKIKFIYLKELNPLDDARVISFPDELPIEFGLHDYIDVETQFEKTFIDPVQNIIEAINWSVTEISTLEAFFS